MAIKQVQKNMGKKETIKEYFEQLHHLLRKEKSSYDFKRICERIEILIKDRIKQETGKKVAYTNAASRLSHTIGKEVVYIESCQEKMYKKNAPKKRADEYFDAVYKAYRQINLDIHEVLS